MHLLLDDPAFRLYAICAAILVLKMYVVGGYTGVVRARNKSTLNQEDVRGSGAVASHEHPAVERVLRAHRNDLENIPAFLALGLIFILAGGPLLGAQICFIVFTLARVMHSVAYLRSVQPWRSMGFGIGALANLALMIMILIRVIGA